MSSTALRLVCPGLLLAFAGGCASSSATRKPDDERTLTLDEAKARHERREAQRAKERAEAPAEKPMLVAHLDRDEGLSKWEIQETINEHISAIQDCYEHELLQDGRARGEVIMSWVIEPDGTVGAIEAGPTTLPPSQIACMAESFRAMKFPPTNGEPVDVDYPFKFKTLCLIDDPEDPSKHTRAGGANTGGCGGSGRKP